MRKDKSQYIGNQISLSDQELHNLFPFKHYLHLKFSDEVDFSFSHHSNI